MLLTPLVQAVESPTLFRFRSCPMQPSFALINGERYPPAKWPIGHPILPTRCGCVRICFLIGRGQYALPTTHYGAGDRAPAGRKIDQSSRASSFVAEPHLLGAKPPPSLFSPPRRIALGRTLLAGARGPPARSLMVVVVDSRRRRGALCLK